MQIIDEQGNLFGVINVIDALVVLMVVAVGVAGVALVFGDIAEPEPELDATGVTLDLGVIPEFIVAEINEGDRYSPNDNSNLTITDVHLTPSGGGLRVIIQAEVEGEVREEGGGIDYRGAPLRLGRSLVINTNRYEVSGRIRDVSDSDTLNRQQTSVLLRTTLPSVEARAVSPGDEIQLAGRTVATVQQVSAYASRDATQRTVFLNVSLETHRRQDERRFSGAPVRRGQTVQLDGDGYSIAGSIERVGTSLDQQSVDVVFTDTVTTETANQIAEGDRSQVAGQTTATVESVSLFGTNNPNQKRVIAGLSLNTVGYTERPQFGSVSVRRGADITFREQNYQIAGSIDRVGATELRGNQVTRTATLRVSEVREDIANAIRPGLVERTNGKTIASISTVEREPSVLILRGDRGNLGVFDHPVNRDVTITAELQVRETTGGVLFKGRGVRQGQTVTLDLGVVTVEAVLVTVG